MRVKLSRDWGVPGEDEEGYDLSSNNDKELLMRVVGRGKRDRGAPGEDEQGYDMPSRPSAPATLFDFLNTKIPEGKEGKRYSTEGASVLWSTNVYIWMFGRT